MVGREIATLVDQQMPTGKHRALWDASHMPSGIYYYQLQAGNFSQTNKMILMK
jgi:hypothetical protein